MTKLSPDFTIKLKENTNVDLAFALGFLFGAASDNLLEAKNGVEILHLIVKGIPEIEIVKE